MIRLTTSWGDDPRARLQVGSSKAVRLHDGEAAGTVMVGHETAIVALAVDHASKPFRIVPIDGDEPAEAIRVKRPGKRRDVPFAVAGTETPDGFTVFFQEVEADDPSAAHTYMLELDDKGRPTGDAVEIPAPWALADAAYNGSGYHLALLYVSRAGVRLSMVSVTAAGKPQQHPDWASAAGFVSDVHLVRKDDSIVAYYRGGTGGDRLLRSDVTAIGSWGREPAKAKNLGRLSSSKVIAITGAGKPKKVAASSR